jgi:hypothetical protein
MLPLDVLETGETEVLFQTAFAQTPIHVMRQQLANVP